jgi:DNA-binding NarL/FixJ family response regulator
VGPVQLSTTQRRVLVALCRAQAGRRGLTSPPADEQIAEELVLSVDEVRAHLKVLYAKLGVQELPETERRHRLVEQVIVAGLISERDF